MLVEAFGFEGRITTTTSARTDVPEREKTDMDKAAEVMAKLAEQLGVAASDLWPALVLREQVEGVTMCVAGVLLLAASVWAVRFVVKKWELICDNDFEPVAVVGVACVVLVGFVGIYLLGDGVVSVIVPEAEAVRALLCGSK